MNKFYVYKVDNIITDESYIGVTRDFESRIKDHIQRSNSEKSQKFQNAISTYLPDNFRWEVIDTTYSLQELALKEIYYINKYDSFKNGYNSNRGGGFKKEVFQFDSLGELLASYECLESAASAVNAASASISHACIGGRKTCKDYIWSYSSSVEIANDCRKKSINQFSLQMDLINTFDSIANASKFTGINKSSIAKCCRGERTKAGDFIWEFSS